MNNNIHVLIWVYELIWKVYIEMKKNRSNIYQKIALEMVTITINLLFICKNIISLKNINGNSTKSLFIFYSLILPNKFSDL